MKCDVKKEAKVSISGIIRCLHFTLSIKKVTGAELVGLRRRGCSTSDDCLQMWWLCSISGVEPKRGR